MAELIQKKLQGEVEKYQQLQKGKGAGSVRPRPSPFTHSPKPSQENDFHSRHRVHFLPHHSALPHPLTGRGILVYFLSSIFFLPGLASGGPFEVSNQAFFSQPADLSKSMSGRQKLEAQLTENNIVKEVREDLWG